jgi:hypothetical protein
MAYQLKFFEEEKTELEYIREDMKCVKESSEKVRRGVFARHNKLARQYVELSERLQIIERNICQDSTKLLQF